jgi:hypothetical protein
MPTRSFALLLAALLPVGFVAGFLAERRSPGPPAEADDFVIDAGAFYLTDFDDKVKASLREVDGVPRFAMLDENGTERIVFAVGRDGGPHLLLNYPDGKVGVGLAQPCTEIRITPETVVHIGVEPPKREDRPRVVGDGLLAKIEVRAPDGKVVWSTDPQLQP